MAPKQRTPPEDTQTTDQSVDKVTQEALSQIPKKISLHSQLPNFKDVSKQQQTVLFISKLRQCNKLVRVDDAELRKLKHLVLYQLLDFVNAQNNNFPLESIPDFFNTVSINIFRQAPKPQAEDEDVYDPEEDEPTVDQHWYHLQFVYEMLLRFVYSSQNQQPEYQKLVKKHIDGDFVIRLMQLFNQSDPRERDYIKTILHRVYANFMGLRAYIRSALKSELQQFICGAQQHSGICDILEILGSIINGYATPLKQEHTLFLTQCLIPLHKVQFIKQILPQLSYCVSKYIEKDSSISAYIIHQILGYFPRLNSLKEVSFLTEIEELLELIPSKQLYIDAEPRTVPLQTAGNELWLFAQLFEIVAQSICSMHFQVAEKAINILSNSKFIQHIQFANQEFNSKFNFLSTSIKPALSKIGENTSHQVSPQDLKYSPIFTLAKALRANCTSHWNSNIRALSEQALKQVLALQEQEFQNLDQKIVQEIVLREVQRQTRDSTWNQIAQMAHGRVKGFSDYFEVVEEIEQKGRFLTALQLKQGFVPGYESEQIGEIAIQAAEVPEDPLFCRIEELCIGHVQLTPELLTGVIDGFFLSYQGVGKALNRAQYKIDENETPADYLLKKGFNLNNQEMQADVCKRIYELLLEKQIVKCNRVTIAEGVKTIQQRLPGKRLANRRASAGIPVALGIRRKSVTPMSMAQAQAAAELKGFEKHNINEKK
ncbi:Protein phosphatase 2A regulatory subunit [Spironucleus salmonicida]|uniref:Protein phosphatase 2A regulatory subunit n=1 Tax=Spironucleus salmonicida TaxID=348837 RepID=V6LIC3_9EUKA|nr:Protein phosphatase 2A regulatory subunit [Spironucleus salmonicida]|eukprot:EST43461.1 Protein phosphatase 2A regulatory subunit [Spironucleus salmonicida]